MRAVETAEGLYVQVCHSAREGGAAGVFSGRVALMCCMEIIRLSPPGDFRHDWQTMYWAGRIETAQQVIREVEKGMRRG